MVEICKSCGSDESLFVCGDCDDVECGDCDEEWKFKL
jgi:hypothetical protein